MAEAEAGTFHPGPASIELPADMVQAMIDHARAEYPNEMCGVIVGDRAAADGGAPLRWVPTRNIEASPLRYAIHPQDLYPLLLETEDNEDKAFWAIVHSHVKSLPTPSGTDIGIANFPDAIYVLVSLKSEEPAVAAWRIVDGTVYPVELVVGH
jgi:proteasome lid subunit RPN8/RPN11